MISNSDIIVTYRGNGVTTVFPITFPFYKPEYICVKILDETTGEITRLDSDYYVDSVAGTVTYPGYAPGEAPPEADRPPKLPATSTLTIYRKTEVSQLIDLGEKYPLDIIEGALDKITEILQEHEESIVRSVKVDETSTGTPEELMEEIKGAAVEATASKNAAAISAGNAQTSAEAAAGSASAAADSARDAAGSLEEAKEIAKVVGVAGEPYDPTKTYNIPDIVITPDGTAWRCLATSTGEYPATSYKWTAVALAQRETFEYDEDGDLMPCAYAQSSSMWQIDDDGDIMPAEVISHE